MPNWIRGRQVRQCRKSKHRCRGITQLSTGRTRTSADSTNIIKQHCKKLCRISEWVLVLANGQVKIWLTLCPKSTFFVLFDLLFDCRQIGDLLLDLFCLWASGCSFGLLSLRQKSWCTVKKCPKLAWKLISIVFSQQYQKAKTFIHNKIRSNFL